MMATCAYWYTFSGYIVEANSQDPGKELVPREVSNGLKKICVLGAAASKFHTAVFTEDGFVFTWGTNKGQLGYSSTTQWTPRKITRFPRQPILQIAATNSATALLTGSNEVYVFSDNEYTKVHFQFGLNLPPGMKLAKKSPGPKSIERIVAGHHQFAILSSDGDVHMWVSPSREFAKAWEQAALSQQAPKCIWRAKKGFLRATDVSIGIDSSVIMTTASGHVFIGKRRSGNSKTKIHDSNLTDSRLFKFTKVPFLHHITKVAASSAGALFAIRKDIRRRAPDLEPSTFRDDIKALLDASLSSSVQSDRFMDVCFHGARQSEIWAHSGILACRSPFLRTLLNNSSTDEKHRISVKRLDSAFHITIDQFHRDSISLVLEYIYAGTFRRSWDSSVLLYKGKEQDLDTDGNPTKAKLYQDFNQLVKLFELDDSQLILYQSSSLLSQKYKESFASLLEESSHKDVIIQLKDTEIACHQFILVSRSKFFKALLGPGSHWTVSQDENIKAFVQLSHVDSSIFHVVLAWMYGETDVIKLFGEIDTLSMRLLLQHFIDILAVADELLLDELKHICTQMLSSLIHIGNVLDLLLVSIMRDAEKLKHNCLDFSM